MGFHSSYGIIPAIQGSATFRRSRTSMARLGDGEREGQGDSGMEGRVFSLTTDMTFSNPTPNF